MKKLICFVFISLNFALIFGLTNKIKIKNYDIVHTDTNTFVTVELEYSLKNNSKNDLFLYDLVKKNDMHFEKDTYSNNIISKQIYIIKPINENSWNASWGYNPCYPCFIKIERGKKYGSRIKLEFELPKQINPYCISYEFNFIITDSDISESLINNGLDQSPTKELKNEIIRFDLKNAKKRS